MREPHPADPGIGGHQPGLTVGSLMSGPPVVVRSEATFADALHQLEHRTHDAYPVVGHDGRAVGLLRIGELEHARQGNYATLVNDLTDKDQGLLVEPWLDVRELLRSTAFRRVRHAVVVSREGMPVGIVSESDVREAVSARVALSSRADQAQYAGRSARPRQPGRVNESAPARAR